ncbi:MAG: hypothetical protein GY822_06825 [Deltaproteobacteria bacterium]|nr:hypothetical protein [Deltaproteobacteria bacterium]
MVHLQTIVSTKDLDSWGPRIAELEAFATYPLGEDAFKLDHGADYFAFFRRMGEVAAHLALNDKDEVIAVAISVLREFSDGPAFYLCDLKVHPKAQGKMLPLRLFSHSFADGFSRCRRGYAISMNPGDGSRNRVIDLLKRLKRVNVEASIQLNLYTLPAKGLQGFMPRREKHRGPCHLLSLHGKKDIVLQSTQKAMPLLHLQFGPYASTAEGTGTTFFSDSSEGDNVYMFCTPQGDDLDNEAKAAGLSAMASATVLSANIPAFEWGTVLTSNI